jgi:hypothetical protein
MGRGLRHPRELGWRVPLAVAVLGFSLLASIPSTPHPGGVPAAAPRSAELPDASRTVARPATEASAVEWQNVTRPGPAPQGRNRAVFVDDPSAGYVLLFGGYDALGSGWLGDTWTYSGGIWNPLSPSNSPGARSSAAAAYDPTSDEIVVFGGHNY